MSKINCARLVLMIQILLAICIFSAVKVNADVEDDLAMAITQFDIPNGIGAMWWTEEFWAGMAYADKTSDAVMGYHMMRIAGKDHLFFSLMPLDTEAGPVETEVPASLTNSQGVKVYEVKVDKSFSEIMPGLIAFPRMDSLGKAVAADEADKLTLAVKYKEGGAEGEFEWGLPLVYPDIVGEAKEWMAKPVEKKESEMTEDEILNKYLPPALRMDLQSGVMAVYFTDEMSGLIYAMDPAMKNDPSLRAEVKKALNEHSIFFIGTLGNKKEERLVKMAGSARATDINGKKHVMDVKARDEFVASMEKKEDESEEAPFEFMLFPQLGKKGLVELILTDPVTEREISFKWEK